MSLTAQVKQDIAENGLVSQTRISGNILILEHSLLTVIYIWQESSLADGKLAGCFDSCSPRKIATENSDSSIAA